MAKIAVMSDSHTRSLEGLPSELVKTLAEADWVVHCGDYNNISVVRELQALAGRFVGVHGNVDPRDIREELPAKTVFEVEGKNIGVIHPSWGGSPYRIEEDIAREFNGVDIILYGHTHEASHTGIDGVVWVNPGQAYSDFRVPASLAILTIEDGQVKVEIKTFR